MLVLDCSITMAWCFEDEATPYTQSVLGALDHTPAMVPSLWLVEISNVLLMAERKKRITFAEAVQFLAHVRALPITAHPHDAAALPEIFALARDTKLTIYDAIYLHLALRESAALATLDKPLRAAAKNVGVALWA